MITVSNAQVFNFEGAIRGMRNPMNSWQLSDSHFIDTPFCEDENEMGLAYICNGVAPIIGEKDLSLMRRLYKAGNEHRKYLRQIFVSIDINAPFYWWKEFDTYKVGTTANSCSTMHKIHSKEFTIDDFSHDHLDDWGILALERLIDLLNHYRKQYMETKNKEYWWNMIQLLPTSYNQKRTVTMTYENVFAMIHQRTGHKLDEWNLFVSELNKLPYVRQIGGFDEKA